MSASGEGGDLDIRSGGIVAVDTETLRAAAARLVLVAADCDTVLDRLAEVERALARVDIWRYFWTNETAAAGEAARRLGADLRAMADLYEVIERQVALQAAAAGGDAVSAGVLRARANELLSAHLTLPARAGIEWLRWRGEVPAAIQEQFGGIGAFGVSGVDTLGTLLVGAVGIAGHGAVPAGTKLNGGSSAVTVTRIDGGRTSAPTSLTQFADRIPRGDGRVRVERYTMPDGSRRFAAYIAGTNFSGPSDEAWDMDSNVALYSRSRAPSYDAVLAALAQSGVEPGDEVTLSGHSQGAMVASFLAVEERYRVPLLVTFGDPVQADVGEATLSVAIRHLDDPVSALAGAGFATAVGAAGSFVASAKSPQNLRSGEGLIDRHHLVAYRDTAVTLDASTDPRMVGVRERIAELGAATSVVATVYSAAREVTPSNAPAPRHPSRQLPGQSVSGASTADAG